MPTVSLRRLGLAVGLSLLAASCGGDKEPASSGQDVSKLSESEVKLRLGLQMYQAGRFQESIGLFEQTLKQDPTSYDALYWRAVALMQIQRNAEALTEFERLLAQRPDDNTLQFMRASVLTQLDRQEEAIAEFDRLLAIHPNDPDVLVNRGFALNKLGRRDQALDSVDKGLAAFANQAQGTPGTGNSLAANVPKAHITRAQILMDLARDEEALAALDRAKAMAPEQPHAALMRLTCLARMGRMVEANAFREECLRKFPNEPGWAKELDEAMSK